MGHSGGQARVHVEDLAAADGLRPAALAQHEAVAGAQRQPPGQMQAHRARAAGAQRLASQDAHAHAELTGAQVRHVSAPPGDLVVERIQHAERGVNGAGQVPLALPHDHVAAPHGLVVDPGEVQGGSVARAHAGLSGVEALDSAHSHPATARLQHQLVAGGHRSPGEGAGHHGARPRGHERPVHPEPGTAGVLGGRRAGQQPVQSCGEIVHSSAGEAVGGDDLGVGQEGAR